MIVEIDEVHCEILIIIFMLKFLFIHKVSPLRYLVLQVCSPSQLYMHLFIYLL